MHPKPSTQTPEVISGGSPQSRPAEYRAHDHAKVGLRSE